jgi:hypothetical protein
MLTIMPMEEGLAESNHQPNSGSENRMGITASGDYYDQQEFRARE